MRPTIDGGSRRARAPVAPFVQQLFKLVHEGLFVVRGRPTARARHPGHATVRGGPLPRLLQAQQLDVVRADAEHVRVPAAEERGRECNGLRIRTLRATAPGSRGWSGRSGRRHRPGRTSTQKASHWPRRTWRGQRRPASTGVTGAGSPAARRSARGGERAAQGRTRRRPEATRAVRPHHVSATTSSAPNVGGRGAASQTCVCDSSLAPSSPGPLSRRNRRRLAITRA